MRKKVIAFAICCSFATVVLSPLTPSTATAVDKAVPTKPIGITIGNPSTLAGNVIQVPVSIPVNLCGNAISIVGLLNPTAGNTCASA